MRERDGDGHQRWDELAAGYALHALEPAEAAEFETHREQCTRCQDSLAEMAFVAANLGALASGDGEDAPPWRRMRSRVVGSESPPAERRRSRRRWLLPAAAATAAVAAAAVVAVVAVRFAGGETPVLTAAACARDAACHEVVLHTSGGTAGATVLVRGRTATVIELDVGAAPAGTEWALWQVSSDDRPMLVHTFRSAPATTTSLPLSYDATAAFALSAETAGSRPKEPTVVVATGTPG